MRILIVEDDRDLAAALDDALRFEGYATRVAYNGLEAVRMLAEQSVVPEKLRTLDHGRPWSDDQFASTRLSSNRDMSR